MLTITRLDHIAIAAADTVRMVEWYRQTLGLVIHAQNTPAPGKQPAYLIGPPAADGLLQGSMIEVMPRNESLRHDRHSHDPGLSHVAWVVSNFDSALAHLKACNVNFLGETVQALGGGRLISFADCEDNMMQIVERINPR